MIPLTKGLTALSKTIFNISGKDSTKFLNGLLTVRPPNNDTTATPSGSFACMLNSKGRVVADLFVYNVGINEYLLEVDSALEDKILRQLEFYKLTSQVDIGPSNLKSWYLWDDDAELALNAKELAFQDFRVAELGAKVLAESKPMDQELADPHQYTLRRYLFGIAEGHEEFISSKTLPLEFNIDFLHGVDFEKGCYVGQELTIRTKHHGVIRKRVVPVVFTAPGGEIPEQIYAPLEFEGAGPGSPILDNSPVPHAAAAESPFGSVGKSRPAGSIIAGMGNIGLASMRIDKLGHQFELQNGTQVHPMMPFWWPEDVTTN